MKYVVIFKAKVQQLDPEYFQTAQFLREKALNQFNCKQFESIAENSFEIALSYWDSLDDIQLGIDMQNTKLHNALAKKNGMRILVLKFVRF